MVNEKKPSVSAKASGKVDRILEDVLERAKPTAEEIKRMAAYSKEIIGRLERIAPKGVEIISAGSVARGTQVRGSSDIDLFLLFPQSIGRDAMEKKGLEIGKRIVSKQKGEKYIIKYAEHPYVRFFLGEMGMKVDIVPAFKIRDHSERITAVDRTQLHNEFVNKHLTAKQKDDVRILKVFLKAHMIYGAEARTEGFSGYLCELLVMHYGSFLGVVSRVASMALPLVIDPFNNAEHHGKSEDAQISVKKFHKAFIVIDPTDPNRNVAAVVSEESLARFALVSRLFLRNPSKAFFERAEYPAKHSERKIARLREELGLELYTLHFKVPDIADDIIWQQVVRLEGSLSSLLKKNGFTSVLVLENAEKTDAAISFFISNGHHDYIIAEGPSVFMGNSILKFMGAHRDSLGAMFSNDRVFSMEPAKYKTPKELFRDALRNDDIFPSYMDRKKAKIYVNDLPEAVAELIYSSFVRKTTI